MPIQLELKEHLEEIVLAGIQSGRYDNAEQVVGTALLAFEKQESVRQDLREVVEQGFLSGYAADGVLDRVTQRIRRRAALTLSENATSV